MHRFALRAFWLVVMVLCLPLVALDARAGGALLQYAPADSLGVVHLDLARLRKTPLFRTIEHEARSRSATKKDLAALKRDAGLDPFKDIDGATLILGPNILDDGDALAVALEGRCSEAAVLRYLAKRTGGAPIARTGPSGPYFLFDRGRVAIAFRGRHVLLAGTSMIEAVLAKNDPKAALTAIRAPVEGDMIWLAARTTADARSRLGSVGSESLETLALGLSVPDGARLQVHGHFADPQQAAALATTIRRELDEAAADGPAAQLGLGDLLRSVTVKAAEGDLRILVELSRKQVDALARAASALAL